MCVNNVFYNCRNIGCLFRPAGPAGPAAVVAMLAGAMYYTSYYVMVDMSVHSIHML